MTKPLLLLLMIVFQNFRRTDMLKKTWDILIKSKYQTQESEKLMASPPSILGLQVYKDKGQVELILEHCSPKFKIWKDPERHGFHLPNMN